MRMQWRVIGAGNRAVIAWGGVVADDVGMSEQDGAAPVEVVAGVITDARGRVLLTRRTEGRDLAGLWEFPGGKREPGETPEAALVRELRHRGATSEDELQFRPSLDELPHERFRAALAAACEQGLVLRTCRGDLEALVD